MKKILFILVLTFLSVNYAAEHYVIYLEGNRTYDNLALGIPGTADQIVDREGYALGFMQKWKQPRWVTYKLTKEEVKTDVAPRFNNFSSDPIIVGKSASPTDYLKSGYDRGHLAPAADMHWSTDAMNNSFYMSNMSPQTPSLNREVWFHAEEFARDMAVQEGSIQIASGPIVTNENPCVIGANCVVVPDLFYKVIYDLTPPEKMVAFVMPNIKISGDIWQYATNVVYVEELTGLNFFPAVDTNITYKLKSEFSKSDWIHE